MVEGHSRHVAFFLMAAMGFLSTSAAHHKTHIVGGSYGWRIPNTTTFYQDWADARDFAVGDKIGAVPVHDDGAKCGGAVVGGGLRGVYDQQRDRHPLQGPDDPGADGRRAGVLFVQRGVALREGPEAEHQRLLHAAPRRPSRLVHNQAPAPAPIPASAAVVRAEHGGVFAFVASSLCLCLILPFLV
ncbi:hypothetical protein ZIOFF_002939 [Zingiber officinale]|uniref:Phytocyanin domain-containing protein n=1 Tax=Zingiber officinale TaxID=94328 RepID=A0A8J5I096_ZINOF|nr:hypothetical protein ZIOFF_002939 [Zingiber officinale]